MSMCWPRAWAHEFGVQIAASLLDLGQATSTDLGFPICKMGCYKNPPCGCTRLRTAHGGAWGTPAVPTACFPISTSQ